MDEEQVDVVSESSPEEVEVVSEDVKTPEAAPQTAPKVEEKTVPYKRFKEVNDKLDALKSQPKSAQVLDVEDYIDISASLDGLDQREKEYLALQHKLTGKPLKEIRQDEDFQLWQSAYQTKKEKELSIRPTGTQTEAEKPKSLTDKLATASMEERERLLEEAGLWKTPRPRADRTNIGGLNLR